MSQKIEQNIPLYVIASRFVLSIQNIYGIYSA